MSSGVAYLKLMFMVAVAVILGTALFNAVIDPYGLYRLIDLPRLNTFKARAGQRAKAFKLSVLHRVRPGALILGNSRAEVGFDPQHTVFTGPSSPAVNLGIPGSGINTTVALMHHALSVVQPKVAVIGLDFLDARTGGHPDEDQVERDHLRWAKATIGEPYGVGEHVASLASLDAFLDSLWTVWANRQKYPAGLTDSGFNPMRNYLDIARKQGYHDLFLQRDMENARSYARGPKQIFINGTRSSAYFAAVEELVSMARQNNVRLHFVIYPYHAHIHELFALTGLWQPFEDWKRSLVELLRDQVHVSLWDFSGCNDFTMEPVPQSGDLKTAVRWYWEAGHFKKELGDVILATVLGEKQDVTPARFGVALNIKNVDDHLRQLRESCDSYRARYPQVSAELKHLVRSAVVIDR